MISQRRPGDDVYCIIMSPPPIYRVDSPNSILLFGYRTARRLGAIRRLLVYPLSIPLIDLFSPPLLHISLILSPCFYSHVVYRLRIPMHFSKVHSALPIIRSSVFACGEHFDSFDRLVSGCLLCTFYPFSLAPFSTVILFQEPSFYVSCTP